MRAKQIREDFKDWLNDRGYDFENMNRGLKFEMLDKYMKECEQEDGE